MSDVIQQWCIVLLTSEVCQDDPTARCPMEVQGPYTHAEAGRRLGEFPPGLLPHRVPMIEGQRT